MKPPELEPFLSGYRALDLTDEKGFLCGKILADLGADVIKIERPGGDPARCVGPFYHSIPDAEKSLYWFAYNLNKRGITLDIETPEGKGIFKRLVRAADFVIESFHPGYMDKLGLGYSALSEINPRIIMTSITPFGQTGFHKDYKASDLTIMAMGGLLYETGDTDRPPVRISFPQTAMLGGVHAAAATMAAHYFRETTGEGQHVDVSMQQCVLSLIDNAIPLWEFLQIILERAGPFMTERAGGRAKWRQVWACKDGFVLFLLFGGAIGARSSRTLVEWMDSEGMADDFLKNYDWESYPIDTVIQEEQDLLEERVAPFLLNYTKSELYQQALARRLLLTPLTSPKDVMENAQLQSRDFWVQVEHPELDTTISYPGAFFKTLESPSRVWCRAPLIGEHNQEIYEVELGLSRTEINALKQAKII